MFSTETDLKIIAGLIGVMLIITAYLWMRRLRASRAQHESEKINP